MDIYRYRQPLNNARHHHLCTMTTSHVGTLVTRKKRSERLYLHLVFPQPAQYPIPDKTAPVPASLSARVDASEVRVPVEHSCRSSAVAGNLLYEPAPMRTLL